MQTNLKIVTAKCGEELGLATPIKKIGEDEIHYESNLAAKERGRSGNFGKMLPDGSFGENKAKK